MSSQMKLCAENQGPGPWFLGGEVESGLERAAQGTGSAQGESVCEMVHGGRRRMCCPQRAWARCSRLSKSVCVQVCVWERECVCVSMQVCSRQFSVTLDWKHTKQMTSCFWPSVWDEKDQSSLFISWSEWCPYLPSEECLLPQMTHCESIITS